MNSITYLKYMYSINALNTQIIILFIGNVNSIYSGHLYSVV